MTKRWGDQWWWRVDITFHDPKSKRQSHRHLTLETAKAMERRLKGRVDVKKVTKSRDGKREE